MDFKVFLQKPKKKHITSRVDCTLACSWLMARFIQYYVTLLKYWKGRSWFLGKTWVYISETLNQVTVFNLKKINYVQNKPYPCLLMLGSFSDLGIIIKKAEAKGQLISKQNCLAETPPKNQRNTLVCFWEKLQLNSPRLPYWPKQRQTTWL